MEPKAARERGLMTGDIRAVTEIKRGDDIRRNTTCGPDSHCVLYLSLSLQKVCTLFPFHPFHVYLYIDQDKVKTHCGVHAAA